MDVVYHLSRLKAKRAKKGIPVPGAVHAINSRK